MRGRKKQETEKMRAVGLVVLHIVEDEQSIWKKLSHCQGSYNLGEVASVSALSFMWKLKLMLSRSKLSFMWKSKPVYQHCFSRGSQKNWYCQGSHNPSVSALSSMWKSKPVAVVFINCYY
jgi:hypothetical protein